jgi:hypothetical protein
LESVADPDRIYEANIQTLQQLGHEGWAKLGIGPAPSDCPPYGKRTPVQKAVPSTPQVEARNENAESGLQILKPSKGAAKNQVENIPDSDLLSGPDRVSRFIDDDLLRARLVLDKRLPAGWVDDLLENLWHRAGLLQSPDGQQFEFAYRFEEFLAGRHLANRDAWIKRQPSFAMRARELLKQQGDYGRQVVLSATGVNAHVQRDRSTVRELVSALVAERAATNGERLSDLELAADIAREAGMEHWQDEEVLDTAETVSRLRQRLEEVRQDAIRFEAPVRSRAASAIGRLGDLRPGVGVTSDGFPELAFDLTYEDDGSPEATRRLRVWWSDDGLQWKRRHKIGGPNEYDPNFQTLNHPRVGISWYEATAFCRWLTVQLRSKRALADQEEIRVPCEAEWEQAARWNNDIGRADGRRFPWGESDEDDLLHRCNWARTGIEQTSAVGLFPAGQAGSGSLDLSGNVWEWCQNSCSTTPETCALLRGGSWSDEHAVNLSCSFCFDDPPGSRGDCIGFRCVWVGVFVD